MLVGRCYSELSGHKLQGKSKKVTSSQDDVFVGVLKKNIQTASAYWAAPRLLRPMYGEENMEHPSRESGLVIYSRARSIKRIPSDFLLRIRAGCALRAVPRAPPAGPRWQRPHSPRTDSGSRYLRSA